MCGNVSDPANADIRPFDMDPRATSQYEIANKLWGLMDGEVEGVAALAATIIANCDTIASALLGAALGL